MIGKSINDISEKDLQDLIDNSVIEGKTLEYKESLPSNSDSDKKEFLADVSSFANASGGDLIIGITENRETGVPQKIVGLAIVNIDQEINRLDSIIREGIEPRIPGITFKHIPLSDSKIALLLRVPRSWLSPHRVSFKGYDKFYSRSTNGKYPLDVAELRVAFTLSETITERIRGFREDRIAKILANETAIPLNTNPKIILHLIPIISFKPGQKYELTEILSRNKKPTPIYCSGWNDRYNFDGFLAYSPSPQGKCSAYVQLFNNGIIEAVQGSLIEPYEGRLLIPSIAYERELIKSFTEYLLVLKTLNIELPIFVFLTLSGVRGYSISINRSRLWNYDSYPIDRDMLLLPEVVIENYDTPSEDTLRPCFDSIWNACGFPKSLNYDDKGKWVGI